VEVGRREDVVRRGDFKPRKCLWNDTGFCRKGDRLQRVNRLDLRLDTVMPLDSDLRLIRDRHFEVMEANWTNFSLVSHTLLAQTITQDTKATMKPKESKDTKDANNNQFTTHETKETKDTNDTKAPAAPVLLRTLGLWGLDLSPVAPDTLGRVVHSLRWANLSHSSLTCCQLRGLLSPSTTSLQGTN